METNGTTPVFFGDDSPSRLYEIADERIEALCRRLDSIARRCTRLGVGRVEYTVDQAAHVVAYTKADAYSDWARWDWLRGQPTEGARFRCFRFLRLTAETPRCEGWEFVATLQHLWDEEARQGINLLRCSPRFEGDLPVRFRTADASNCDHCGRKISTRKDTFVVHHVTTDAWQQVGRSCLCDFLGGHSPEALARSFEYGLAAAQVCGEAEEDGGGFGGGHGPAVFGIADFLAWTAAVVRLAGWLSRSKAGDAFCGPRPTADVVLYLVNESPHGTKAHADWSEARAKFQPTEADRTQAAAALDYTRETLGDKGDDRNDFEHNLYVAVSQPVVTHKTAGVTAYLISYYLREVERVALRAADAEVARNSQYFGEVGKRADYYVRLLKVVPIEGNYGTTYLHRFITREGNVAVWFASSCPGMIQGAEYRVAASVKSHGERNGARQTQLTRVTVYTEEGRAQAEAKDAKRAARAAKKAERDAAKAAKAGTPAPTAEVPAAPQETVASPPAGPSEAQKAAAEQYAERRFRRRMKVMCDNFMY